MPFRLLRWPYEQMPCAHMPIWYRSYDRIVLGSGRSGGEGSQGRSQTKLNSNLMPLCILNYTLLYLWEYAICPYGLGDMSYAHMVIRPYLCPWELPLFEETAKSRFNALCHTVHMGICHMPVWAGPHAICPYIRTTRKVPMPIPEIVRS